MDASSPYLPPASERRSSDRHSCKNPSVVVLVTEPLAEQQTRGTPWNISTLGACLVLEPQYHPGNRLSLQFLNVKDDTRTQAWGYVRYSILIPSSQDMYLTGFELQEELSEEELPHYV
jgi:hypothetical protein